jgi:hypothetical protein
MACPGSVGSGLLSIWVHPYRHTCVGTAVRSCARARTESRVHGHTRVPCPCVCTCVCTHTAVRVSRVQERTAGPVSDVRRVRWDRDRHGCVPSPVRVGRHDVRDRIVLSLDRHGMIDNTVDLASTVRSGEMSLDIGILYLDVLYQEARCFSGSVRAWIVGPLFFSTVSVTRKRYAGGYGTRVR